MNVRFLMWAAPVVILGLCIPGCNQEAFTGNLKAATRGDPKAQYNLAVCYDDGDGVAENDAEAVRWYRAAAEQGHTKAQFNLGLMYRRGKGVVEAYMWLSLAAVEDPDAVPERDALEKTMRKDELAEAKRRAVAYKPKTWEEVKAAPQE